MPEQGKHEVSAVREGSEKLMGHGAQVAEDHAGSLAEAVKTSGGVRAGDGGEGGERRRDRGSHIELIPTGRQLHVCRRTGK